jgi:hypothetical protein
MTAKLPKGKEKEPPVKQHQDPETHAGMTFIAIYFFGLCLLCILLGATLLF